MTLKRPNHCLFPSLMLHISISLSSFFLSDLQSTSTIESLVLPNSLGILLNFYFIYVTIVLIKNQTLLEEVPK